VSTALKKITLCSQFVVGSALMSTGLQLFQLSVTTTEVLTLVVLYLVIDLYSRGGK
jgi:uncharacterized membrane-anchored protein YitT (DUF2179 family)